MGDKLSFCDCLVCYWRDAYRAILNLNGVEIRECKIVVKEAEYMSLSRIMKSRLIEER